jgi:4a-hydroxytetrahydrobiopterin dehydratase
MTSIPKGWTKKDGKLYATFECKDFAHAIALLNSIAEVSENLQHHPDIGIRNYCEVFVTTITHSTNSLSEKDYMLANKINDLL